MRSHRNAGFTVIELLLASIVLMMLLGFATIFLNQGSHAHRTVTERSSQQEVLDSVTQLLLHDFRLAGYQGDSQPPTTLSEAITTSRNAATIHYSLTDSSSRSYEVTGPQRVTYTVEDQILTRCHALSSSPSTCIGGAAELAHNIDSFEVDATSLHGNGALIEMQTIPYDCDNPDCHTSYSVRIPFPQPLPTGAPQ